MPFCWRKGGGRPSGLLQTWGPLCSAHLGPRPPPLPLHQGQGPQQVWGLPRSHKDPENDHQITNSEDGSRQEGPWAIRAAQRAGVHLIGTGRCPPDEWGAGKKGPTLFPWDWGMLEAWAPGLLILTSIHLGY